MAKRIQTDVCIVGSGPVGAMYARRLVPEGRRVIMLDAGAQQTTQPGRNLKNVHIYQRSPDSFSRVVQGCLHPLSPSPIAGADLHGPGKPFNPRQDPTRNLEGAATAYAVGGMGNYWTCVIPRQHPAWERSPLLSSDDWERYYGQAEQALQLDTNLMARSVRHNVLRDEVAHIMEGRTDPGRDVACLPFAVQHDPLGDGLLQFSGTETVLRPILDASKPVDEERFRILQEHLCTRLKHRGGRIHSALVTDLQRAEQLEIEADTFVVACGTVLSAQLLWASGLRAEALGRYMTEHIMSFGQVHLREELRDGLRDDPRFEAERASAKPDDPLRLPARDLNPNVWIPTTAERHWHVQITKDIVHFSPLPQGIDDRTVVDLRWYASVEPRPDNRVTFEDDLPDSLGMPRPTMHFEFSDGDRARIAAMQQEQQRVGEQLGSFVPGAEITELPSGLCLHLQGVCRMGDDNDGTSVCDTELKVWDTENLYVAGNATIPTENACNPTLTAVALAARSAERLTR